VLRALRLREDPSAYRQVPQDEAPQTVGGSVGNTHNSSKRDVDDAPASNRESLNVPVSARSSLNAPVNNRHSLGTPVSTRHSLNAPTENEGGTWQKLYDEKHGSYYFYNNSTGESFWEGEEFTR